jgi:UDP-N-acetylglucosamine--N-acetylmuramyl-(pentapeptide) pyrophosphoryl-undecaprenol N-acetylglucosamine transferase
MRVLIAGGGTGGHIYPALAIAEALRELAPGTELLFVGARGRMEMEKIPQAGYPIEGLPVAGWQRRLSWRNLLVPFLLLASLWMSWRILRRFRPDVAVGVGGYASGPALRVANWMGIPTVLQEQNSYAGLTNRLLAGPAAAICVAWEGMERYFPAAKLIMTGNPLRADLTGTIPTREEALEFFGLDPVRKTILLLGGSLGAPSLNQAVMDHSDWWEARQGLQLIWQCGRQHFERCSDSEVRRLPSVSLHAFIQRMDMAYGAADLIIARAGALTIAELCQVGKPVILVPSPHVAEDHQTSNARALESGGAAILVPDREVRHRLFDAAESILADAQGATAMGMALRNLARPDAAHEVARIILQQNTASR